MNPNEFTKAELTLMYDVLNEVMSSARPEFRATVDILALIQLQNKVLQQSWNKLNEDAQDSIGM